MKNRFQKSIRKERQIGIHFSRILVDFGTENRPKMDQKSIPKGIEKTIRKKLVKKGRDAKRGHCGEAASMGWARPSGTQFLMIISLFSLFFSL